MHIKTSYLKELTVANPLSTASGVLVRSCDASLGAIFLVVDNSKEGLIVRICLKLILR